jgi:hypothetical protein
MGAKPNFPIYIVSKGRSESRLTSRTLESLGVFYFIVIEEQEYDLYSQVIDPNKILILDRKYQEEYDTFDNLGDSKSKGPGPARNFAWDHSISNGHKWHWVMDDNIRDFYRLNKNLKVPVSDGAIFKCMEDFVLRYENIGMAGPNYFMFASRKNKMPPFALNTRIYSCNLIRNDISLRWRGRYNEDTDLSLRLLKCGWCTVQFNAFLQGKVKTQTLKGGNTEEFYSKEGTLPKSKMLERMHPDVSRVVFKWGRWHHQVDYSQFKEEPHLKKKKDFVAPEGINDYGMVLRQLSEEKRPQITQLSEI